MTENWTGLRTSSFENIFKALKVLEFGFWSLKVVDFFIKQDRKIWARLSFKLNKSQ